MEECRKISEMTEESCLVVGKRVAAELLVLCLSVMSLGENPLQIQKLSHTNVSFAEYEELKGTERLPVVKTVKKTESDEILSAVSNMSAAKDQHNPTNTKVETTTMSEGTSFEAAIPDTSDIMVEQDFEQEQVTVSESKMDFTVDETEWEIIKGVENPEKPAGATENKISVIPDEQGTVSSDKENNTETIPDKETRIEEIKPEEQPERTGENTMIEKQGLMFDESGKITGICDRNLAVADGCLIIPAEGCTGIAAGAFLNAGEGIVEVYLPETITDLEEGAFLGLNEMEWIETSEENPVYSSSDGVLFTKDGTCLTAFPAGRTGIYPLPESVTRIAEDAFAGASIEKLSNLRDREIEFGNLPESIVLERY